MRKKLTDSLLRATRRPAAGRLELADARAAGLVFRLTKAGSQSWGFRFRDPATGKDARATIGAYPDVPLATARRAADELRRVVASGINPNEARRRERMEAPAKTFKALADRYVAEHARRHKRSAPADERNLRLHVLPKWGKRPFTSIRRGDAIELVEGIIAAGKPTLANRVHALISTIFAFAVDADLLPGHPFSRLKKRGAETIGRRVLSDGEIRLGWPLLVHAPISRRVGLALRLALLTGARAGEVAGARRGEFSNLDDASKAGWVIPAERVKNGRSHFVPLSPLAAETVRAALELVEDGEPLLFPSPSRAGSPVTAHSLAVAMARFAAELQNGGEPGKTWRAVPPTPHDLRRTVATRLSELGIPKDDRDAVLNHVRSDVGSKHYDLYDRAAEKRRALNLWATTLAAMLEVPRVVSIKAARVAR